MLAWSLMDIKANNVSERYEKSPFGYSLVVHTYNVLFISGRTRGPVTTVSLYFVNLKEIFLIKTYSTDYVNCPSTYGFSFLLTFFLFCYFGCTSCYEISLLGFKEKNKDEQ